MRLGILPAALVVATILAGCGTTDKVPNADMQPTLPAGSTISVSSGTLELGQIIVFHPPAAAESGNGDCAIPAEGYHAGSGLPYPQPCAEATAVEGSQSYVKRIVGMPGDTLRIVHGLVYRNGVKEDAPYATACPRRYRSCTFSKPVTVPAGTYYVMADRRAISYDSTYYGPIPAAWVVGHVVSCSSHARYCTHG
jgi:signal peptidase I